MKTAHASFISLLIAISFLSAKPASAETAEEMLSSCRPIAQAKMSDGKISLPRDFDSGVCWGAFATLDFMLTTVDSQTNKPMFQVCVPLNRTRPQLIAVFVKYIEDHPSRYAEDFQLVAFSSEQEAFPCPVAK